MSKPHTLLARAARSVAVSLCLFAAHAAHAQTPTPTPTEKRDAPPVNTATPSTSASPNTTAEPDLSITGSVTARELQFEVVPTPKVEFPGRPRRDTVWEAERTNLPPQVQPGVTYRDIGIRLKITSVFADIERIVAEALGEIPTSDDAPPQTNSNDNTQPTSDAAPTSSQTRRIRERRSTDEPTERGRP
ncbi:MAG TPA: hypothetical protein VGW12_21020 [Pyrinomonadaceae bacterium]|nr:hypothetical protein [Pyrinomonadaceae bacterium]